MMQYFNSCRAVDIIDVGWRQFPNSLADKVELTPSAVSTNRTKPVSDVKRDVVANGAQLVGREMVGDSLVQWDGVERTADILVEVELMR